MLHNVLHVLTEGPNTVNLLYISLTRDSVRPWTHRGAGLSGSGTFKGHEPTASAARAQHGAQQPFIQKIKCERTLYSTHRNVTYPTQCTDRVQALANKKTHQDTKSSDAPCRLHPSHENRRLACLCHLYAVRRLASLPTVTRTKPTSYIRVQAGAPPKVADCFVG